jgi:transporter family-2 protein
MLYSKIIFAALMDHFALLGVAQRDYTVWRILASLGLVGCVVVIAKF